MIREMGLSRHTVRIHCWYLEQFLGRLWEHHRSLDEVVWSKYSNAQRFSMFQDPRVA